MGLAQKRSDQDRIKKRQRAAYDRRAGNDRRSAFVQHYDGPERRHQSERRRILKEKRLGWVRDTQWSSINLDLLR